MGEIKTDRQTQVQPERPVANQLQSPRREEFANYTAVMRGALRTLDSKGTTAAAREQAIATLSKEAWDADTLKQVTKIVQRGSLSGLVGVLQLLDQPRIEQLPPPARQQIVRTLLQRFLTLESAAEPTRLEKSLIEVAPTVTIPVVGELVKQGVRRIEERNMLEDHCMNRVRETLTLFPAEAMGAIQSLYAEGKVSGAARQSLADLMAYYLEPANKAKKDSGG